MGGRPDWDEYFLRMLPLVASRTSCLSRKVGAIITLDNRIVATGYNGPPPGQRHCGDLFGQCYRKMKGFKSGERLDLCRAVHAEENAILQCARGGLSIKEATLYLPVICCYHCSKLVVSLGIKRLNISLYSPASKASKKRWLIRVLDEISSRVIPWATRSCFRSWKKGSWSSIGRRF